MSQDPQWFVYILKCDGKFFYTGITTDVSRRVAEHRKGPPLGAKYMRGIQKIKPVYSIAVENRSMASKIEYRIKKLPRIRKDQIISNNFSLKQLMAYLEMKI